MGEARPRQLGGIDVIGSQTGDSNVCTKDCVSLSFSLCYEGFCVVAFREQKQRLRCSGWMGEG